MKKEIAFCITCMNRLSHIQQTLVQNMENNFLPDKVEFILLDYNSSDGLEEWAKTLQNYIDIGILHYYRTNVPAHYHRSHSRNMAFRLSDAEIVCNLDADNFLGKGFSEYILQQFIEAKEKMFMTSNFSSMNIFGRFCACRSDFMHIRGYNELLSGYGTEDSDLFNRLIKIGLRQNVFYNNSFCKAIEHSHKERISQEFYYQSLSALYIYYDMPFRIGFLLLHKDFTFETGYLINHTLCHYNEQKQFASFLEMDFDISSRITVENTIQKGKWSKTDDKIQLMINHNPSIFSLSDVKIQINNCDFYKVSHDEVISIFILHLSNAVNYAEAKNVIDNQLTVNPTGFGQGTVYKNFDYTTPIILY
ncbi:MAG: glycosyltransferase family 2 protein [Candidatus Azobacteroides sp.]|nr:glycosyltransferase family 2 protein [Candidatus Azobacteroides sp.]